MRKNGLTVIAYIKSKIEFDFVSACWNWKGSLSRGYGKAHWNKVTVMAHRFVYEIYRGKIREGLTVDHLCRNRRCVNPEHLQAVTSKENILRGVGISAVNAKKTHCKRGHAFTEENTSLKKLPYGVGRRCRTCHRESELARKVGV